MHRLVFALCLLTVAAPAATRVAYAEDAAERTAKRHYARGKKLYDLQKFQEALDEFQKAYDAKALPGFLFNIGQCQRNLGDYKAAVFSYKKYLKLDPEADDREQVETLIDDLQRKIDEADTNKFQLGDNNKRQIEPPPKETGDRPVYKKWWFWTGAAVVAAGAGVGIYLATRPKDPDTTFGNIVFRR
jgi:tetratricopeptide (TPR) repeat protein